MVLEYLTHFLLCDGKGKVADKYAAAPRRLVLIPHLAQAYGCTLQLERGAKLLIRIDARFIAAKRDEELLSVFAVLHLEDIPDFAIRLKHFSNLLACHIGWDVL